MIEIRDLLLPPSLREWLPEDHLAWLVLEAVAEFDLAGFYPAYRRMDTAVRHMTRR